MTARTKQVKQRVVRTGVSPMNPRVKWAALECGHEVFLPRRPRVGAMLSCPHCRDEETR